MEASVSRHAGSGISFAFPRGDSPAFRPDRESLTSACVEPFTVWPEHLRGGPAMDRLAGKVALIRRCGGREPPRRGCSSAKARPWCSAKCSTTREKVEPRSAPRRRQGHLRALNVTREATAGGRGHGRADVRQARRAGQQRRHSLPVEDRGHERGRLGSHYGVNVKACSSHPSARSRPCDRPWWLHHQHLVTAGLVGSPGETPRTSATRAPSELFTSPRPSSTPGTRSAATPCIGADRDRHDQGRAENRASWEQRLRRLPWTRGTPEEVATACCTSRRTRRRT